MPTQAQKAEQFRYLHQRASAFVMPNPWDAGSAKVLASLGFEALATTSAGLAFTFGRVDGTVSRDEALANAAQIVTATDLPVSADLENLYAHGADEAAGTITLAADTGLVGCSIEDATGYSSAPIYAFDSAVARVAAAANAARALPFPFTLTARAENFLHGRRDLADTIQRLQAYDAAGADVLYAPGLSTEDEISAVVGATRKPVNVLVSSNNAHVTVAGLERLGVRRISTGGALARAALGGLIAAGEEIRQRGTFLYGTSAPAGGLLNAIFSKDRS